MTALEFETLERAVPYFNSQPVSKTIEEVKSEESVSFHKKKAALVVNKVVKSLPFKG